MKKVLIILNVVLALWPVYFGIRMTRASDSIVRRQVLELCKEGVISESALRAHFSDASDPAGSLALSLSQSKGYFNMFIWPLVWLALLNAITITVFWRTDQKTKGASSTISEDIVANRSESSR